MTSCRATTMRVPVNIRFGGEICHSREDPRFTVAFDEFPGVWPGWRRAFTRAAAEYVQLMPDWHYLCGEPPGRYAHQQLYYAVKSRVNAAAHRVADEAGVEHRDLSLWLVKQHGFPWRRDCTMPDLLRLLSSFAPLKRSKQLVRFLNTLAASTVESVESQRLDRLRFRCRAA
jgi:hypothetical protein